jgi:hypothetical protein
MWSVPLSLIIVHEWMVLPFSEMTTSFTLPWPALHEATALPSISNWPQNTLTDVTNNVTVGALGSTVGVGVGTDCGRSSPLPQLTGMTIAIHAAKRSLMMDLHPVMEFWIVMFIAVYLNDSIVIFTLVPRTAVTLYLMITFCPFLM